MANAIIGFFISGLLLLPTAHAEETISEFKIVNQTIKFYNYPDLRLTTSASCPEAKDKGTLCKNLDFLNTVSMKKLEAEDVGNQNPSSFICKKYLNGKVLVGYDSNNNENSFCKLPDGLYVDGGTIAYYAHKNDGHVTKPRGKIKKNK